MRRQRRLRSKSIRGISRRHQSGFHTLTLVTQLSDTFTLTDTCPSFIPSLHPPARLPIGNCRARIPNTTSRLQQSGRCFRNQHGRKHRPTAAILADKRKHARPGPTTTTTNHLDDARVALKRQQQQQQQTGTTTAIPAASSSGAHADGGTHGSRPAAAAAASSPSQRESTTT